MTSQNDDDLSDSSTRLKSRMKRAFSSKSDQGKEESKRIPDHEAAQRCQELKQKVVKASHRTLASFLPDRGGSLDHPVLLRFWGSVDGLCRVSFKFTTYVRAALISDGF